MIIVPSEETLTAEASAVTLARYAQIIRQPPNSFYGVVKESEKGQTGDCFEIFTKPQRDMIARYLAEAQEEIEQEVGYFLSPRWVVGRLADQPHGNDRYVDDQAYVCPLVSRWPKIIAAGVRAVIVIEAGAAIDQTSDPAVIGPIATSVTEPGEIAIYHPGTDVEITPSSIVIAGGSVTIKVPRCRTVLAALSDNPETGLDYSTLANFETTVDVSRVYTDPSVNAELVTTHRCSGACAASGCGEHTTTGCEHLDDARLGVITVRPAAFADGAWGRSSSCAYPLRARLNYLAGLASLTRQAEDAIVRLAHCKMPMSPCGCDFAQLAWKRDRTFPEVLTRERINCPFGPGDGAWVAFRFAQTLKQLRGSVL